MNRLKMRNKEEKRSLEILKEQQENPRMKDLEIMCEEVKIFKKFKKKIRKPMTRNANKHTFIK